MGILLSNFYPKGKLCVIKGQIEQEIRSSYYGGITAVHENSMITLSFQCLLSGFNLSITFSICICWLFASFQP
jgi:hypothetical protein